ncbi:MAG: hypothetical protein FJZ96_07110 [Chloroflexi bacterium]|nr:hypothetical protein [Chloroflexota bacterium]
MKNIGHTFRRISPPVLAAAAALAVLVTTLTIIRPSAQGLTPTPPAASLTPSVTPTPTLAPGDTSGIISLGIVIVAIIVFGVILGRGLTANRKPRQ